MRVLHLPHNISGGTWRLVEAERRPGLESEMLTFRRSYSEEKSGGINLELDKHGFPVTFWKRVVALLAYQNKYDIFHFNWSDSFINSMKFNINHWDMPLLSALGKKLFTTFQGCDIRQKGLFLERFELTCCTHCDTAGCGEKTDRKKAGISRRIARYSTGMFVSTPDLLTAVPQASVLPQIAPEPPRDLAPYRELPAGETLRVFHSPTTRAIKGTRFLQEACKRLAAEGYNLALVLSEGRPWSENIELMRSCHLVVDQLCTGWYGGVSVEAMTYGLPVICFINDELRLLVGHGDEIPIISADVNSVYTVLRECLEQRGMLVGRATMGPPFVEKYHSPDRLALVTARAYGFPLEGPASER